MSRGPVLALVGTLLLGLVVLAVLVLRPGPPDPVQASLASVGAALPLPRGAALLEAGQEQGRLRTALIAIADDRVRVRVSEGLDADAAGKLVTDERYLIENLFEDHQAPYPGALSHTLQCPDKYRPADVDPSGDALAMLSLYANDRFGYGGCSEDLLRYHATVGFFYAPSTRRLFRLEYFAANLEGDDEGAAILRAFQAQVGP